MVEEWNYAIQNTFNSNFIFRRMVSL